MSALILILKGMWGTWSSWIEFWFMESHFAHLITSIVFNSNNWVMVINLEKSVSKWISGALFNIACPWMQCHSGEKAISWFIFRINYHILFIVADSSNIDYLLVVTFANCDCLAIMINVELPILRICPLFLGRQNQVFAILIKGL